MKIKILIFTLFTSCIFACSPSTDSLIVAAKNSLDSAKFQQAIEYADKAINKDPKRYEPYNIKAVALFNMNKMSDALESVNKSIALKPTDYKPYFNRGNINSALNNNKEALNDYNNALKYD